MTQNASTYYTTISYETYIFVCSLYIPIGIFGIIGNTVVLVAYVKYKQFRQIECAHLIAALSISDLISGYGNILLGFSRAKIALFNDYGFSRFYCIATAVWVLFGLEMSQVMTAAIAIDRLIAVGKPLFYRSRNHKKYAIVSFLIAILYGCSILVFSFAGVDFSDPPIRCTWTNSVHPLCARFCLIGNALFGPLIAGIYAIVVYEQWKWSQEIRYTGRSALSTACFSEIQMKVTKLVTKLVIIYIILDAIPLATLLLAITFNFSPNFTNAVIVTFMNISVSLNSSINVIIYALSSSALKPFILKVLPCGGSHEPDTALNNRSIENRPEGSQPGNIEEIDEAVV